MDGEINGHKRSWPRTQLGWLGKEKRRSEIENIKTRAGSNNRWPSAVMRKLLTFSKQFMREWKSSKNMGDRYRDGHPERNGDPYIARIPPDTLPSSASYNERFQQCAILRVLKQKVFQAC